MPSVTITSITCTNPATHAYSIAGTATNAAQVTAELRFIDGQTGLSGTSPIMVTAAGATNWNGTFNTNPANSNYVAFAQLNDGTQPPPSDQKAVPPCVAAT
jgi:hypothetical protein